jgi:ribonuclease G
LPLWFRRKKADEQAPAEAAAQPEPQHVAPEAAPEAATTDDQPKPKRRRGSRGGRGRKKPEQQPEAKQQPAAKKAQKPEAKQQPAAKKAPAKKTQAKAEKEKPEPKQRARAPQRRRREPQHRPLPAAKRELLVSVDVGEQRVAVLEDERVAEVYLERPERRSIAGNIYLGVVDNVLPGMEAAFIEIGLEKNGFLYVDEIVTPELEGKRHGRKIQDLISRGETLMVQAVKDPMKTKGARLTTDISLAGRFVVYQPNGEGIGVSRRLDDDERTRLKEVVKALEVKEGGVIVRTAAEGASAEDVERDLVFLQRVWKSIQARAKEVKAPALVYQEAELPLRVTRDLFTGDFERALVDDERTMKRIVGYLKKTSPHMVERVQRYRDKDPLMDAYGVDAAIKSTLSRRVDLPSGGYLIFDYAEAFTVIDVNTGRFVGSRSKTSGARLEDTITKNNLEAVKEVVRQLRLRDVGGIIVIDFIDMANPRNRAQVEEALRTELERDRTKTYVVEISPLGLVEMTRQNVTDGPREILTRKCPTCGGDGIVLSETSAAVEIERRLRALAAGSRSAAFKVEVSASVAALLIGPGAARLRELEERTKKRFVLATKEGIHNDHFVVLGEGTLDELQPEMPVPEGDEAEVKLVEVGRHDASVAVGKLDGVDVCVADAAKLVGRKVTVRIERVLDGSAYATLVEAGGRAELQPLTAEGEAEKPTRKPPARKAATVKAAGAPEPEAAQEEEGVEAAADGAPRAKKRTRRGTRGGRGRKKPVAATAGAEANGEGEPEDVESPKIHVPDRELDAPAEDAEEDAPTAEAEAEEKARKKTRRGSRGGRGRKRRSAAAATNGEDAEASAEPEPESEAQPVAAADGGYVPMSEWIDDFDRSRP